MPHLLAIDSGTLITLGVLALIVYLAVLWIALAFWVVRDARRRSPTLGFVAFAVLIGFIPPFLGPLIYMVIRPPRTIEEERQLALEEQALLEPLNDETTSRPCPSCGREIEQDFVLCPYCRTQFARRCEHCQKVLRLGWEVCPYCATEVGVQALNRRKRAASS